MSYTLQPARFSVNMSYYGISYSIPNLSGDRYLNFMIGGGIELGAYLLAYVVLNGIGRKYPLMVCNLNLLFEIKSCGNRTKYFVHNKLLSIFLQVYLFLSGVFCIGTVTVKQYVPGRDIVNHSRKGSIYLYLKRFIFQLTWLM